MTPAPVKSLPRRSGNGGHGGGGGHDNTGAMRWLLTYADLITLLMVFFVVMYSISTVQAQKWAQVASSLKASFYGGTSAIDLNNPPGAPGITGGQSGPSPLEQAGQAIAGAIASDKLPQGVAVYYGERGLTISVEGSLLFPGGQAYLTPEARKVLIVIAGVLAGLPNKISVEGHTDNYPIHNAQFPSNWDLSVARAVAVVRFLTEDAGLKPDRFIAVGRAQWDPLYPNDTPADRAKNRRVDLVVLRGEPDTSVGTPVEAPAPAGNQLPIPPSVAPPLPLPAPSPRPSPSSQVPAPVSP